MVRRLFDEVWRNGGVDSAERFYAAGPTLDDLQAFATDLYAAFPDWRATIDERTARLAPRGQWTVVADQSGRRRSLPVDQ